MRTTLGYALVLLAALAVFVYLSLNNFVGAGRDDVYISLWAGENLARGHGLVNYNFERAEISSSLLHTVLIAALTLVAPQHTFLLNKALGLLTGAAALTVIVARRRTLFPSRALRFAAITASLLALASSAPFLYWNLGGLETPIQTLLLFLYGTELMAYWQQPTRMRHVVALVGWQCLYMLVRPEGFVLIGCTVIYAALHHLRFRQSARRALVLVIAPVAFCALLMLARYFWFGLIFPNPVYAKTSGLKLDDGFAYLSGYFTASAFAVAQLASLAVTCAYLLYHAVRFGVRRAHTLPDGFATIGLALPTLVVLAVVLASGGDWMEFFRFVAPTIPLLVILTVVVVAQGGIWLTVLLQRQSIVRNAVVSAALVAVVGWLVTANGISDGRNPVTGARSCPSAGRIGDVAQWSSVTAWETWVLAQNCAYVRDQT
ncbi:MAG: hypothetical protein ABI874_13760, partial [Chloroflexota bacterium]